MSGSSLNDVSTIQRNGATVMKARIYITTCSTTEPNILLNRFKRRPYYAV
jgi:hypothetical protein